MIVAGLRCTECGNPELVAIWPGGEGEQREMFEVMKCWCEACWLKSFGPVTRLPVKLKGRVAAEQRLRSRRFGAAS